MYPGDEDTGSMSSWEIFNMLGLYPLSPASGTYHLGSPLFTRIELTMDGPGATRPLVISSLNNSATNVYVQRVTWNGAAVAGVTVAHADLAMGGVLEFTMGPAPAVY